MHSLLVVDEEEAICFAMRVYFQLLGYRVDCAQNFAEADDLLSKGCYTVMITDLRLAGIGKFEGLDVIRRVRQLCPQTRLIVLTAYGSAELRKEVQQYAVDALLYKPKPLPDVAQVVYGLVGTTA